MRYSQRGFTIVELLIVIVIIGILAALIIVSYNGIQQRAKNNQTVAAVGSWVKALKMHYIETGSWLNIRTCLGETTTYPGNNCWVGTGVNTTAINTLRPYLGNGALPVPDTTNATNSSSSPKIGIMYTPQSGTYQLYYVQIGTNNCVDVGGWIFRR